MDAKNMLNKVEGALASVVVGDALGFPGHDLTQEQIESRFGGRLTDFFDAFPDNPYHEGVTAASITDDSEMTIVLAEALVDGVNPKDARYFGRILAEWAKSTDIWEVSPMYGPTTKASLRRLIAGEDPIVVGKSGSKMVHGSSNGSAMKISPCGLVFPGDIDGAIRLAVHVAMPTHGTQSGIAGACVIAAGVAEALREGATVFSVAAACLEGARQGERIGKEVSRVVPAPDTVVRTEMAIEAAIKARDIFEAGRLITATVGNGLPAYEAVPAAVGLFVAAGGNPEATVIAGANIGGDSDTIASMAGAMAGALSGLHKVPADLYKHVCETNNLNIHNLAERLVQFQGKVEVASLDTLR